MISLDSAIWPGCSKRSGLCVIGAGRPFHGWRARPVASNRNGLTSAQMRFFSYEEYRNLRAEDDKEV
jgi:hypothetical protein